MSVALKSDTCLFCKIIAGEIPSAVVYRDEEIIAFLDIGPLFHGHLLVCPVEHHPTITDLPCAHVGPFFIKAQRLTRAVEVAMKAEGSFLAINNRVSQTVPHLHMHIVPRRTKDGLRGFFWPRNSYQDDAAREAVRRAIEHEAKRLLHPS